MASKLTNEERNNDRGNIMSLEDCLTTRNDISPPPPSNTNAVIFDGDISTDVHRQLDSVSSALPPSQPPMPPIQIALTVPGNIIIDSDLQKQLDNVSSLPPLQPPLPPSQIARNALGDIGEYDAKEARKIAAFDNDNKKAVEENVDVDDEESVDVPKLSGFTTNEEIVATNEEVATAAIELADSVQANAPTERNELDMNSIHESITAGVEVWDPTNYTDHNHLTSDDGTPIIEAYMVEDGSNNGTESFALYEAELFRPLYKQKRFIIPALMLLAGSFAMAVLLGSKSTDEPHAANDVGSTTCNPDTVKCGPDNPCRPGICCSNDGYCGISEGFCGECCQQGGCWDPSDLSTISNSTSYVAGNDSRMIAYIGNWEECPTPQQIRKYSHVMISVARSYEYRRGKNICNKECDIGNTTNICGNENRQDLVDSWKSEGKKVILQFGGTGMGTQFASNQNNCWDYCFGKEEELSSQLVHMVEEQNLDGISFDYPYCSDVNHTQYGRCIRRTNLYSDEKAQFFLSDLTSKLRSKLDALQVKTNHSRYELSHHPLDQDLLPESKYFQVLQEKSLDLDYLFLRYESGFHQPGNEIFGGGSVAGDIYESIVNDMFDGQANKVVVGFCISDCSDFLSNSNSSQAIDTLIDLKEYNSGQFACNGGASLWLASHDHDGVWSSAVLEEIMRNAGCSNYTPEV